MLQQAGVPLPFPLGELELSQLGDPARALRSFDEYLTTGGVLAEEAEYDRIVANAEGEVALARRRAVEEASERMGELVLEVVERIIGREVDAATHRDLIDEAVAALNATDGAATARSAGARS